MDGDICQTWSDSGASRITKEGCCVSEESVAQTFRPRQHDARFSRQSGNRPMKL